MGRSSRTEIKNVGCENTAHKLHMTGAEQNAKEKNATLPKGETWEKTFWPRSPGEESAGTWGGRRTQHHCRLTTVGTGLYINSTHSQRYSVFLRQDGENQIHTTRAFSTRKEAQTKEI